MFYKQKDQLRRWWFGLQTRCILKSPPIRLDDVGPTLLTLLQHKDVQMYLAAIKSFARRLAPNEVHIVDDGSLTNEDHILLGKHVPGLVIHALKTYREADLPIGGCWERLSAVARLSETQYVIQLDADTLTVGDIPEVAMALTGLRADHCLYYYIILERHTIQNYKVLEFYQFLMSHIRTLNKN